MWLVCATDSQIVPTEPPSLRLPSGLESGQQLAALLDDCERVLRKLKPARVVVLDPETNNQLTFAKSRGRVTGEVIMSIAAAQLDIHCSYMSRKALRSQLGLPASGKLSSHAALVVAVPLSPNWRDKRDLASLAALAGQEITDAER